MVTLNQALANGQGRRIRGSSLGGCKNPIWEQLLDFVFIVLSVRVFVVRGGGSAGGSSRNAAHREALTQICRPKWVDPPLNKAHIWVPHFLMPREEEGLLLPALRAALGGRGGRPRSRHSYSLSACGKTARGQLEWFGGPEGSRHSWAPPASLLLP